MGCHTVLVCVCLVALATGGCAAESGAERSLTISEIGSMHVSGRAVTLSGLPIREVASAAGRPPPRVDPNGDFEADQMYVQYVKLAVPRARYPLLMIHGGGLTGVTWENQAGW